MATKTENTAQEIATLRQDKADKYAPENLMLYRTTLALIKSLAQRVEKLKSRYEILCTQRERRLFQADTLSAFLFALKELDILNLKWTPTLWHTTVDKVIVNTDGSVVFHFKNGSKITV